MKTNRIYILIKFFFRNLKPLKKIIKKNKTMKIKTNQLIKKENKDKTNKYINKIKTKQINK